MSGFMKSVRATAAKELRPDDMVLKIQYNSLFGDIRG